MFTNSIISILLIEFFLFNLTLCTDSLPNEDDDHIKYFENLTKSTDYDKRITPPHEVPLRVNVSFYMYSFGDIDESKTEYRIYLLMRLEWFDYRLKFPKNPEKISKIEGGAWLINKIWTPALHIPNNIEPGIMDRNDQGPVFAHIGANGFILLSRRVQLRAYCKMDFRFYPLDRQSCDIELESTLSENRLILDWAESSPFDLTETFSWSGFALKHYTLHKSVAKYSHSGNFSKLIVTFTLDRELGHFFIGIYLPAILFVITSWSNFWIDIPAAPARVSLGITTMLTLITSAKSARDKLPTVSYISALDVWYFICTLFIFASLVEYATVNHIYNKDKRCKKRRRAALHREMSTESLTTIGMETPIINRAAYAKHHPRRHMFRSISSSSGLNDDHGIEFTASNGNLKTIAERSETMSIASISVFNQNSSENQPIDLANDIDRKCRIIFPVSFVIFNIIYWAALVIFH